MAQYGDDPKEVVDPTQWVQEVYNVPEIPDSSIDKKIFSNNYYYEKTLSVDNIPNISRNDASNENAANLNSSTVHRNEEATLEDADTLATVTKATCSVPLYAVRKAGLTIVQPPAPEPEPDPEA